MKYILLFILLIGTVTEANSIPYSRNLSPQFEQQYYINQALKYFDTLDSYVDRKSKPNYSKKVIRWEWYPWLKLTGYKKLFMKLDWFLTLYPTEVINRDCRFFDEQPFARCRVTFIYRGKDEKPIDIYEEFTFNDLGEVTFIEAWSDIHGMLPMNPEIDYWAEGENINRLSTKIPGLGTKNGLIQRKSKEFIEQSKYDSDLMDLRKRLRNPVYFWLKEALRFLREGHGH